MDLLDCLLGHDAWTTRRHLLYCRDLSPEQLDQLGIPDLIEGDVLSWGAQQCREEN